MAEITITAEERNEIWDLAEFALGGASEGLVDPGGVDFEQAVELRLWFTALDELGYERTMEKGCEVSPSLTLFHVLDAAEKQALEVLQDSSLTLAEVLKKSTADEIAARFLPPADGDTEGKYLIAVHHIKAVRERMEEASAELRGRSS